MVGYIFDQGTYPMSCEGETQAPSTEYFQQDKLCGCNHLCDQKKNKVGHGKCYPSGV